MHRKLLQAFGVMALAGVSALAGSFTSDFSDPNQTGFTLTDNGAVRADGVTPFTPAIESGHLVLTYNETGEIGTIVLDDLDGGQQIESFTAKFKLRIGPGSGNPADGTSFCFGPDINSTSNFSEEGTGTGIIVCFDIYDNGLGEAPAVDVKYGGATLATTKFAKADMVTSKFEDVFIQLTRAGTLNVGYKGQVLYTNLVLPDFAPTAGQFALGARTGGQSAIQWIDDLDVQTVVAGTTVAPTITADPQSQTIDERADATFTVGFDGSAPLAFEWHKNDTLIAGANGPTLTLTEVLFTDNQARIKCTVSNPAGSATSKEATLTVVPDLTPPTLVSAKGSADFLGVVVAFSEPVADASGGNKNNYTIAGLTIDSATVLGANVVLATSKQAEGATYTVVVSNVKDRSVAGNTIAAGSQVQFKTFVFMLGRVLHKKYDNIDDTTGGNPDNLFSDPRFPNQPDRMDLESRWEYPADGAGATRAVDPARNYFDTLEGYFIPPADGNYVFLTAGADRWWLYLSTDEDPANKYMIAAEPGGWSDPRGWLQMYSGSLENRRSDQSALNMWPFGATITLTGGKRYYLLEVHHDPSWCGADDFSATYKLESEDDPASGTAPTLAGSVVGCYVDPSGASVTITQQPADATAQEGRSARFTVAATGTSAYGGVVSYQWQRQAPGGTTWADLAGATAPSYSTPLLTLADNGAKYRAVCSVPGVTATSLAATLTVLPATAPPKLVWVGSIVKGATVEIGVGFDQNVDITSASKTLNYGLSQGVITGLRYEHYAHTGEAAFFQMGAAGPFYGAAVVLTTSGLAPGDNVTVTVKNVKNLQGYAMPAAGESKSLTITRKMKWAAMGGNDFLEGNPCGNITADPDLWPDDVVAYSEADFDLISSGSANWANYDEATFVYEEVTGDFDKVVRVEYQDPTSQWARAGLCATPSADEGMTRADVAAGAQMEKRFLQRANPATIWNGTAGNNDYEGAWRLTKGGSYSGGGASRPPAYPTAWLRMQRAGQVFTAFCSNDGAAWTQYQTVTFSDAEPMPDKLLVGPYYSPEMCNNGTAEGVGHSSVAKFRDFGNYQGAQPQEPRFTAWRINANGTITIEWTGGGTLQTAPSLQPGAQWQDVTGAISPYTFTPSQKMQFGRIKK